MINAPFYQDRDFATELIEYNVNEFCPSDLILWLNPIDKALTVNGFSF